MDTQERERIIGFCKRITDLAILAEGERNGETGYADTMQAVLDENVEQMVRLAASMNGNGKDSRGKK